MNLRRRIALFIDPSLIEQRTQSEPGPEPVRFDLNAHHYADMAYALEQIAKSVKSLDQKTVKRRPRIVMCEHPELHPEVELVA